MKYIILILIASLGLAGQTTLFAQESFDVKVIVTNVNSQKGKIRLGVFNNSKHFLDQGKEYKTDAKSPSGDELIFYLNDLKKGEYAISLYHDIDSDNKCNLNFLLRPSEPYGFSNNVKLKLFKPDFEDCKVLVNEEKTIRIDLVD